MSVLVESYLSEYVSKDREHNFFAMNYYGCKYNLSREQFADIMFENLDICSHSTLTPFLRGKTTTFFDIDSENIDIKVLVANIDKLLDTMYDNPNKKKRIAKNKMKNKYHLYYPEIISTLETRKYIHSKINGDEDLLDNKMLRIGSGIRVDGYKSDIRRKKEVLKKERYVPLDADYEEDDFTKRYFNDIYPFRDGEPNPLLVKLQKVNLKFPKQNSYLITSKKVKNSLKHVDMLLEKNEVKASRLFTKEEKGNIFYNDKTKMWTTWIEEDKLWMHTNNNSEMKRMIHDLLEPIYMECIFYHQDILKNIDDEDIEKKIATLLKQLKKKELIIRECVLERIAKMSMGTSGFMDDDFDDRLDVNTENLPINDNRVINIKTLEIRERTREDYWSFYFKNDFLGKDISKNIFEEFMKSIFDTDGTYNFMRDLLGYMISYDEKEQIFIVFTNEKGRNGKGIITQIAGEIFSQFIKDMSISLIINNGKDKNDEAELNKLRKGRTALFGEPPAGKKWKNDILKKLSGGDVLMVRDCFQKGADVKPLQKGAVVLLSMNDCMPDPSDLEPAILSRLCMCYFPYYFRGEHESDYDKDDPNCKLRDDTLKKRMLERKDELFTWWVMAANGYVNRTKRLMDEYPDEFKDKFDEYVTNNDNIGKFLENHCETGYGNSYLSTKKFGDYLKYFLQYDVGLNEQRVKWGYSQQKINTYLRSKGHVIKQHDYDDLKNTTCVFGIEVSQDLKDKMDERD